MKNMGTALGVRMTMGRWIATGLLALVMAGCGPQEDIELGSSQQAIILPEGYTWTQIYRHDYTRSRLIETMYCDAGNCMTGVDPGFPWNEPFFSTDSQGNINSLVTSWDPSDETGFSVSDTRLQLTDTDVDRRSVVQAEGPTFAFYQDYRSFDAVPNQTPNMMTAVNYRYSRANRPAPWAAPNNRLLMRAKVAMPNIAAFDTSKAHAHARMIAVIVYENAEDPNDGCFFYFKPTFYDSDGTIDEVVKVDENSSILMVRSPILPGMRYLEPTSVSKTLRSSAFGTLDTQLIFEVVVRRGMLRNMLVALNDEPGVDCDFPLPQTNSDWARYKLTGFKLNAETNPNLDGLGEIEPVTLSLRMTDFRALSGDPQ